MKEKDICYIDSIQKNSGTDILVEIRDYLQFLHHIKIKSGFVKDEIDFSTFSMTPNPQNTPQQSNKFDYGAFCLRFSKLIASNEDITKQRYDIHFLRKEMRDELLLGELY